MTEISPAERPLTPEQHGLKAFKIASRDYPGSATTQGARIAIYCQENQLSPEELKMTIITNDDKIEFIQKAAIANHVVAANGPTFVSLNRVKSIVSSAFTWAEGLIKTNPEEIQTLFKDYESYPKGKSDEEKDTWETSQEQRARKLIEAAKIKE